MICNDSEPYIHLSQVQNIKPFIPCNIKIGSKLDRMLIGYQECLSDTLPEYR